MEAPKKIPEVIGRYRILESVGSGGLGEVFKAIDSVTGEIVAVKRLHERHQSNNKLLGLFHKEIMIHSRVSHKNCVRFIAADLKPPDAHIVTSFVNGQNCHNLLRLTGALPPLVACALVLDMLQGLEHLHCLDIIHSDITPSNCLVERNGNVKLADFGLSIDEGIEDYKGMTVGTPGYQAPERVCHDPISVRSDIYCVGIILHELIAGERLFPNLSGKNLISKMKSLKYDWLNCPERDLTKVLVATLKSALAYKPGNRFENPRDFMFALYKCLKMGQIRYTRRAIQQWLLDMGLGDPPYPEPTQEIYWGAFRSRIPEALP